MYTYIHHISFIYTLQAKRFVLSSWLGKGLVVTVMMITYLCTDPACGDFICHHRSKKWQACMALLAWIVNETAWVDVRSSEAQRGELGLLFR